MSEQKEGGTMDPDALCKRDRARADEILRGTNATVEEIFGLGKRLQQCNDFGYARKLFGRIDRAVEMPDSGKISFAAVRLRHALCTYKDVDLPAIDRFERALELLDEIEQLCLQPAERQEGYGLRGAVYKRKWQVEGQRTDLVRSRNYYLKGYEMGADLDQGYTGINAALVLDLLAREEVGESQSAATKWTIADDLWRKAWEIRTELVKSLPGMATYVDKLGKQVSRKGQWWFHATLAEAYFGLGQFDKALDALREYNQAVGLGHNGPPLDSVAPWEFESTITQLATLAQLQARLVEWLEQQSQWEKPATLNVQGFRQYAEGALREYLGEYAVGVDRAFNGRFGLALSGGGFRASLFHIGVLASLAERDLLRNVEVLSCVSGGSIVGAHYYLEVQHLLESKTDKEITCQDYVDVVQRVEGSFLAGIQRNIRSRTFGGIWANLRMVLQGSYTTTRRLGTLYEKELYARIVDGRNKTPRHLKQLLMKPRDEPPSFKPKYDNWRRACKIPMLVLNATTLNTGHNWQFTGSWMGEPPSRLDSEIGGNYRLRRMYHSEAPRMRDKWSNKWSKWFLRPFAPPDYQSFRLGEAVAASSCVPGLFDPLVLPDLYDGKTVRLVDGGVYDNQGIASLLEQDCTFMVVSDASGQMDAQNEPSSGRLGVSLRSFSLSMARVRQAQFQELDARRRSGLLRSLTFLHLRKDLDAAPADWRECQDPHEASEEAQPAKKRGVLTSYGMQKSIQRLLSAIRTDLDSFTEVEAFALMTSGYRQASTDLAKLPMQQQPLSVPWRFLQIDSLLGPGPGFDDMEKQLRIGRLSGGKVWFLSPLLTVLAIVLIVLALIALVALWWVNRKVTLLTVGGVGIAVAFLAAGFFFPHVVRIIRFQKTFRDTGLRSLLAAVVAIGFKIHLAFFDPLFLRLGRLERMSKRRSRS